MNFFLMMLFREQFDCYLDKIKEDNFSVDIHALSFIQHFRRVHSGDLSRDQRVKIEMILAASILEGENHIKLHLDFEFQVCKHISRPDIARYNFL